MDDVKNIINDLEWLKKISEKVDLTTENISRDFEVLKDFCLHNGVFAMAAIQLGIDKRIIYVKNTKLEKIDVDNWNEEIFFINPVIKKQEGLVWYWESCASCLDNMGLVLRPYKITIEYRDINNKKHRKTFKDFPAVVISHEYDHLDGILHIDKALKVYDMKQDDRIEFRKKNPYKVFYKDGSFIELETEFRKKNGSKYESFDFKATLG